MVRKKGKPIGILIDSSVAVPPSAILTKIRQLVEEIGDVKIAKIVLLQKQAIENSNDISQEGFVPVIVHDDLDIQFALEAMELIYNEKIETIALATENEGLLPLLSRARELGKEVVLLHATESVNRCLQNAVDLVLPINP